MVGINLLREGLVSREVSLAAILYPDRMTDSMKKAMDETARRRAKQITFNEAHGITPEGVNKKIKDMIDGVYSNAAQMNMVEGIREDAKRPRSSR